MIDIVTILNKVISELQPIVKVKTVTDNLDGTFTLDVCNSSYLRTGSIFTYEGYTYTVKSIVNNTTVILSGGGAIVGSIPLNAPLFITDTPQGANNELKLRKSQLDKHPFIWLLENFPTEYRQDNSGYLADARVRLFFLDVSKNKEWLNKDHRDECINPMRNLIDTFITALEKKVSGKLRRIGRTYTLTDRVRFGVYSGNTGNNQSIIDESLSGVELEINIPVKDWVYNCCDCDYLPIDPEELPIAFNYALNFGLAG